MRGGGQRPFGIFPFFHPFWWCHPSLRLFRPLDLSAPGARVHVGHWLQQWAKKRTKREQILPFKCLDVCFQSYHVGLLDVWWKLNINIYPEYSGYQHISCIELHHSYKLTSYVSSFFCEVALVAFCCSDPVVMIALWVRCVRCDCGPEHGNEKRPNLSL